MTWFHTLSSTQLAVVVIAVTLAISLVGLAVTARRVRATSLHQTLDNGAISGLLAALIGIYAIAAGLTVAAAATTAGLGVDMLAARDRYVLMPTEAGWRDGVGRETATNALLGTSLALAAVTVGLAIFTDWDGAPTTAERALLHHFRFAASPDGAAAQLGLTF